MFCLFGQRIKHVWLAHAYHTCSSLVYVRRLFSVLKMADEEEALVDVAENGDIDTEEAPSHKRKQSKGRERKWNDKETDPLIDLSYLTRGYVRFSELQYLKKIITSHSYHFTVAWSIFHHHFVYDHIIEVSFLFSSLYSAPGLPSSTFSLSIFL